MSKELELSQIQKLVRQLEAKIKRQEVALDESKAQFAAAKNMEALAVKAASK